MRNELPRSKLTGYPQLTAKMETQQAAGNLPAEIKYFKLSFAVVVVGFLLLGVTTQTNAQEASSDTPVLNTTGEKKTLVIIADFEGVPSNITNQQAYDMVFNEMATTLREVSYQKSWLSGKVIGPYTLPSFINRDSPRHEIEDEAFRAADADAYFPDYDFIHVIVPPTSTGGRSSGSTRFMNTPDGHMWKRGAYLYAFPNSAFLNGGVILHEMGHNWTLKHSNFLDCPVGKIIDDTTCADIEYADIYCPMGDAELFHFNAAQKDKLGWFNLSG